MPLRHMKSFACLLFLLPTLALAQDYLGQYHPRVRIYANGNDYISNVVGDIIASRSRGETRIDRANNYARQQAYEDAVANLAALRAHQAATERAELDRLMRMANSRAQPPKPPSAEFLATQKRFESKPWRASRTVGKGESRSTVTSQPSAYIKQIRTAMLPEC